MENDSTKVLKDALKEIDNLKDDYTEKDIEEIYNKKTLKNQKINGKRYHPAINFLVNQLHHGYSPLVGICGKYGRGKSTTALRISEILHNEINVLVGDFDPEEQVMYEVLHFLYFLRSNVRKAIIFEEADSTLNSKDWYTDLNRVVEDSIKDQRIRQMLYLFVSGKLYELHKPIRNIIDLRIEHIGKGKCKCTIFKPQYGSLGNKKRKKIHIAEIWDVKAPSDSIYERYKDNDIKTKATRLQDRIDQIEEEYKDKKDKLKEISDIL